MSADTAEEAYAYFTTLPEAPGTFYDPAVGGGDVYFGRLVHWPGREAPEFNMFSEKYVPGPEGGRDALQHGADRGLVTNRMRSNELSEQDAPLGVRLVTLAAVLATTNLTRRWLAKDLGWTAEELSEREKDPGRLTLAEVERIGALTQRPVEQLLRDLREEMRARIKIAQAAAQEAKRLRPVPKELAS